ncbi:CLUMA_CG007242, isoform A [Clunio marinus]|uniref:CLUMA_CG007242, isoform A n=1 Tax=Clunio marinus TaxID=568069 RepID=A0A1J1I1T3_9DIPT|nr:CLUMA_CG007242, isoform A [Clunio marinus]
MKLNSSSLKSSSKFYVFQVNGKLSKRFMLKAGIFFLFWAIVFIKNIFSDFAEDTKKQFSAILGFCLNCQTFLKLMALCNKLHCISAMRVHIVEDIKHSKPSEVEVELKYRRLIRRFIFSIGFAYLITTVLMSFWSLICIQKMVMPFQVQVPLTKPDSHPFHEVNLAMIFLFLIVIIPLTVGLDSMYVLVTLHCVSKLSLCCHLASKIDKKTDEKFILELVKKHLRAQEIIHESGCVFNIFGFIQLASAFGFIFEEFQQSIYCSNWYEIKNISIRKNILFMLKMTQQGKGYFALGIKSKPLNLRTYGEVIKQSYAFMNFLLKIM